MDADEGQLAGSELPPLTTEDTVKLAFMFCFFWFVANWAVNASLDYTTVASATILSSMSGETFHSQGTAHHETDRMKDSSRSGLVHYSA